MREINREIWLFCVPLALTLLLLIAVPDLTLGLPRLFGMR
jgi:TRAP-type C4-dicarboxylate transport system permease large subunit